jgi:hypothetical protein
VEKLVQEKFYVPQEPEQQNQDNQEISNEQGLENIEVYKPLDRVCI